LNRQLTTQYRTVKINWGTLLSFDEKRQEIDHSWFGRLYLVGKLICTRSPFFDIWVYTVLGCHVTLTYLFSPEMNPSTKFTFFLLYCSVDLWEIPSRYRNNFNGQVYRKLCVGIATTPNMGPSTSLLLLICKSQTWTTANSRLFHFQLIILCWKVFPINHFQRQSCLSKCLKGNRENKSNNDFSAPLAMTLCSNFPALYFRNVCINVHVWYIVGKLIKRSNWILRRGTIS